MGEEKIINGVNIDALFSTVGAIKSKPGIAKFRFHTTNTWIDGTHNRATISGFYGAETSATGSACSYSARMWSADISTLRGWGKARGFHTGRTNATNATY